MLGGFELKKLLHIAADLQAVMMLSDPDPYCSLIYFLSVPTLLVERIPNLLNRISRSGIFMVSLE